MPCSSIGRPGSRRLRLDLQHSCSRTRSNDDPLGGLWCLRLPAPLPLPMAGCLVPGPLASWKVCGPLWRCVVGGFGARLALCCHLPLNVRLRRLLLLKSSPLEVFSSSRDPHVQVFRSKADEVGARHVIPRRPTRLWDAAAVGPSRRGRCGRHTPTGHLVWRDMVSGARRNAARRAAARRRYGENGEIRRGGMGACTAPRAAQPHRVPRSLERTPRRARRRITRTGTWRNLRSGSRVDRWRPV
jgi:hypothetical protein